jgi:hypothetical protein
MRKTAILALVNIVLVILILSLVAQQFVLLPKSKKTVAVTKSINIGAVNITFTPQELQTWLGIKDRLAVVNTDPNFSDPEHRVLQWISMRNSSSIDYYQKSMEFLCFWRGQGANGEWEAVISIYNSPNSTADFVVEVSRFTWHSLEIMLDGKVIANFPQVTNDTLSLGYTTFHVSA